MYEGRRDEAWDHTSALMVHQVNLNLKEGASPLRLGHFHPFRPKPPEPKPEKIPLKMLKGKFTKRRGGRGRGS